MGLAPRVAFFITQCNETFTLIKNVNIHLLNFFQFFLTSFFNYPAAILG